jgi:hypothetical protein
MADNVINSYVFGSGGTPPDPTLIATLNFEGGDYLIRGVTYTDTDILGGSYNTSDIVFGRGYFISNGNYDTQNSFKAIGDLLTELAADVQDGITIVFDIEFYTRNSSYGGMYIASDDANPSFASRWIAGGHNAVTNKLGKLGFEDENSISDFTGDVVSGEWYDRVVYAVTHGLPIGGGNYRSAAAANGGNDSGDNDVAYPEDFTVASFFFGRDTAGAFSGLDSCIIHSILIYEGKASADLDALCPLPVNTRTLPVPTYANVKLHLEMDGTDGATTVTDSATSPKTVTFHGNAQIDTAIAKWSASSLLLDGDDWLSIPFDTDFRLGSGEWQFDFWAYIDPANGSGMIFSTFDNGVGYSYWCSIETSGVNSRVSFVYSTNGSNLTATNTGYIIPFSTWVQISVDRKNHSDQFLGVIRIRINGVTKAKRTSLSDSTTFFAHSNNFTIGADDSGVGANGFTGNIQGLRFTKGQNVNDGTDQPMNPPTGPWPNS